MTQYLRYLRYCPQKKTYVSTFFTGRWRTFTDKYHRLRFNYFSRCSKEKLKELNALECHTFEEDKIEQSVFDIWFHNMGKYKILIPKDNYNEYLDTLDKLFYKHNNNFITSFSKIYFPNQDIFNYNITEVYDNYLKKKETNEYITLFEKASIILFKNDNTCKNKLVLLKEINKDINNLINIIS